MIKPAEQESDEGLASRGFVAELLGRLAPVLRSRLEPTRRAVRREARLIAREAARLAVTAALCAVSIALLLCGAAGALAECWHGPRWSGDLAAGALGVLASVVAVAWRRRRPGAVRRANESARVDDDERTASSQRSRQFVGPRATTTPQVDAAAWIRRHTWLGLGSGLAVGWLASRDVGGPARRLDPRSKRASAV